MPEHPQYLVNEKTGVAFPWNERMARLSYMRPTNELPTKGATGRPPRAQVPPATAGKAAPVDEGSLDEPPADSTKPDDEDEPLLTSDELDAIEEELKSATTKEQIKSIALENFGVEIDDAAGRKRTTMKKDVTALIKKARKG